MTKPVSLALCSAQPIAMPDEGVPEWLHLLPAGPVVTTGDGRGPYRVEDTHALMAASIQVGDKLVLDENHSTDLAAPKGEPAPARGWIVELQQRADGIWGRVEWTPRGRELMENREYRGVSPVIAHLKNGTVVAIRRASLTNQPNLQGLTSLHQEDHAMDLKEMLVEALGLGEDADDAAIAAAVKKALGGTEKAQEAVQSALSPLAKELGLADDADGATVLAGVVSLKAAKGSDDDAVTALQSELADTTLSLNALKADVARKDAVAFVDSAIQAGRVGVKPMRDRYISMHMADAAGTEELVNALPKVEPGRTLTGEPATADADAQDDPVQLAAHAAEYQKKCAERGQSIDFGAAVMAVKEGRHK